MIHSFYDSATGLFTGRTFSTDEVSPKLAANTPAGCIAMEGEYDYLSQCIDVASGAVIDYQPPQPSADHEWNADAKRWQLTAAVQARQAASAAALAAIAALEARGVRALRELALGQAGAADRLAAIDGAIAGQRALL